MTPREARAAFAAFFLAVFFFEPETSLLKRLTWCPSLILMNKCDVTVDKRPNGEKFCVELLVTLHCGVFPKCLGPKNVEPNQS